MIYNSAIKGRYQSTMKQQELQIDQWLVHIERKPIKNIYLKIKAHDGKLIASMPLRAPIDKLQRLIVDKRDWIIAQQLRLQKQAPRNDAELIPGEKIAYLGKEYDLELHQQSKPNLIFDNQIFHFYLTDINNTLMKTHLLTYWYKEQMQALLPPLQAKWQAVTGVKSSHISLRTMKTRWGSCNIRDARITLNINLMKKPLVCLEYTLVHELVHLYEPGHNQRFYSLMTQFMPEWREYQQILEPGRLQTK
ncbi:M48 family metallopeptidase [Legionella dresdenensis]|uniref:M48 family metallopeptidase n=1 Tax=Legionella dresdenensis TaxID=450200 RepID=A0ABV8CEY1_9GAMM